MTLVLSPSNNSTFQQLKYNIRLRFKMLKSDGSSPQCVIWDSDDGRGSWSGEGCRVEYFSLENNYINCSCNHLSSFAVLMEMNHKEFVPAESLAQCMVSYLAIVTSLILLASTFVIFCLLKGSQTNSNTIHISLVASIFSAELIFLIALKSRHTIVYQQFPCKMVAILLHFLFLSTFSWLLVEAIHIYRMMTNLRDVNHGQMHCYFFIGFGGPALIVGLSVGVSVDQYGNHFFCWLSVHENVVWSLVGPICIIVIVTLGVFVFTLKSSLQVKDTIMDYGNLKTLLWLAIMLLPIQGSTWVLAMLSVNETHVILQYAFSIFCLLEGIYIFTGYCVVNKKVQYQLCRMWMHASGKEIDGMDDAKISYRSSAYNSSSRVSHRSIGVSTSSATSRSTTKTSASPHHSLSQTKMSVHDTSDVDEPCQQRMTDAKECPSLADIINGNHPSSHMQAEEAETEKKCDASKFPEGLESLSPGPKMGINIFSYPNLPGLWNGYGASSFPSSVSGSHSPINKPPLTLKTSINVKDQQNQWEDASIERQTSSPSSAPICSVRPEFPIPRMGISGVEKSMHTSRDRLIESFVIDSAFTSVPFSSRAEPRVAISQNSTSNTSSKEILSDSSCPSSPLTNPKHSPGRTRLHERRMFASRERLMNGTRKPQPGLGIVEKEQTITCNQKECDYSENIKSSSELSEMLNCSLPNCTKVTELCSSPVTEKPLLTNVSKKNIQTNIISLDNTPVHTQSSPENGSLFDRVSPKLIDDTPSEEDFPVFDTSKYHSPENESRSCVLSHLINRKTVPPLATAELSDTDFNESVETAV